MTHLEWFQWWKALMIGGLVKGFLLKNLQTKKINCPKKELCGVGQQKNRPRTTDDHHFWRRRDKRWGWPIFQPFPSDNRSISWHSLITLNKGHAATLANFTPCAKSSEDCCTKTAKVDLFPVRRKLKDGFNWIGHEDCCKKSAIDRSDATTNQTIKEDDERWRRWKWQDEDEDEDKDDTRTRTRTRMRTRIRMRTSKDNGVSIPPLQCNNQPDN